MTRTALLLLALAGCSGETAPPPVPAPPPPAESTPPPKPSSNIIQFAPPVGWMAEQPTNNMRKAQYKVPDKEKQHSDGELALFYFGTNDAMIQANIERWIGQVEGAQGKPESIEGKCRITLVDLSGTYVGDAGKGPQPDSRLLAAVVEAQGGPWYFKLVGPAATVGDWRGEFVEMLKGAQK